MIIKSCYDFHSFVDERSLPFILARLEKEPFAYVKSLSSPGSKEKFKEILKELYEGRIGFEEAYRRVETTIIPGIKPKARWGENLVRSECSKIFTLGYGDYLLSIGETECYIPSCGYVDEERDCAIIENKTFPIKMIQDNIYSNYNKRNHEPKVATVPLHAQCRHIITKKQ